jgi:hypothetical protein
LFKAKDIGFNILESDVRRWFLPYITKAASSVAAVCDIVVTKNGVGNDAHNRKMAEIVYISANRLLEHSQ